MTEDEQLYGDAECLAGGSMHTERCHLASEGDPDYLRRLEIVCAAFVRELEDITPQRCKIKLAQLRGPKKTKEVA